MPKIYYVYILASQRRVLYIGMTSNIEQRVFQNGDPPGKRNESLAEGRKKIKLIESTNPKWRDLSYGWYQRHRYEPDRIVV